MEGLGKFVRLFNPECQIDGFTPDGKADKHKCWTIGAWMNKIGFWGFLIIIIVQWGPKPILIIKAPSTGFSGQGLGIRPG